ncbi:MAG: hypothetical protein M3N12_01345, partial [Verrucomicrobiota bacterium]|nr:hypothetical protein [Verrucomicrobiota bacterium]
MKQLRLLLPVWIVLATALPLQAQIDSIVKGILDHAASQNRQGPSQRRTKPQQSSSRQSSSRQSKRQFDGTWTATQSKTNPQSQQTINRTFTMIIKEGKATKTLDTTNASTPDKPFYASVYELQRRWTYNSIDCTEQGTSLTIQWSPGQLADWAPKTIPNPVIEGFG